MKGERGDDLCESSRQLESLPPNTQIGIFTRGGISHPHMECSQEIRDQIPSYLGNPGEWLLFQGLPIDQSGRPLSKGIEPFAGLIFPTGRGDFCGQYDLSGLGFTTPGPLYSIGSNDSEVPQESSSSSGDQEDLLFN